MDDTVMEDLCMTLLWGICGCHCYGGSVDDTVMGDLWMTHCYGGSVDDTLMGDLWMTHLWGICG